MVDGRQKTVGLAADLAWWCRPGRLFGLFLLLVGLVCGTAYAVTEDDAWRGLLGAAAAPLSTGWWFFYDVGKWRAWRAWRALTEVELRAEEAE